MDGMASISQASRSFYKPLLISLAGIVSTSLAIVAYHLILVRYCLRRRRLQQLYGGKSAKGVGQKVLETIPILSYSTRNVTGDDHDQLFRLDQSECAVCLGELEEGDMVRVLPNCSHAFHVPCIDKWFLGHSNCPICRSSVAAPTTLEEGLEIAQSLSQGDDDPAVDHVRASSSRSVRSGPLLHHCASLVLPMEGRPRCMNTGYLKRSFSMGQSYFVINTQGEREQAFSAFSSSSSSSCSIKDGLMQSRTYRVRSMRQLDRMSSRLLRSFSQLGLGRGGSTSNGILPY